MLHLTVTERDACLEFIRSTFGKFHSVLKHAEHRTLNTYTEQYFYPDAVAFFLFYRVALGYTEHDGTNRTRSDILL